MTWCDLCGRIEEDDLAIEEGCWPYYWITEGIRRDEPVCPECAHEYLEVSEEEPILRRGT